MQHPMHASDHRMLFFVLWMGSFVRVKIAESKIFVLWRWLFNLSITAVFIALLFNWSKLLLRLRLGADNSIFQNGWLVLFTMTVLLLLTAVVHELGHLLAGYLVRFQFHTLIIGPLRLSRENGRLQIQFQRSGTFFDGLAASLPVEGDQENLRQRLLYFALGGPLASLALTLAALLAVLLLDNNLSLMLEYLWVWECSLLLTIISYFFLLTALRPGAYQNGFMADGGRILMALRNAPQTQRWQALLLLNVADLAGKRPSQWDPKLIEQAHSYPDNSYDYLTAVVMSYQHWLDKKRPQEALTHLEEALNLPTAWRMGMRARLALEKAYLMARYFRDVETAQEWFQQVRQNRREANILFWRAKAALHFLEGKNELAKGAISKGLASAAQKNSSGLQQAEVDWLKTCIVQTADG